MILKENVLKKLEENGLFCTVEEPLPHGTQLRFSNGTIINIYSTGKITIQGKNTHGVEHILGVRPA